MCKWREERIADEQVRGTGRAGRGREGRGEVDGVVDKRCGGTRGKENLVIGRHL